jgi:hypothetical protein
LELGQDFDNQALGRVVHRLTLPDHAVFGKQPFKKPNHKILFAAGACGVVGKGSLSKRLGVSPTGCPSGAANPQPNMRFMTNIEKACHNR